MNRLVWTTYLVFCFVAVTNNDFLVAIAAALDITGKDRTWVLGCCGRVCLCWFWNIVTPFEVVAVIIVARVAFWITWIVDKGLELDIDACLEVNEYLSQSLKFFVVIQDSYVSFLPFL